MMHICFSVVNSPSSPVPGPFDGLTAKYDILDGRTHDEFEIEQSHREMNIGQNSWQDAVDLLIF